MPFAEWRRMTPAPGTCPHCGAPASPGTRFAPYCCAGCQAVHRLLADQHLNAYYEFGARDGVPAAPTEGRSLSWLDPLVPAGDAAACSLDLDIQGLHCAGCVWLVNELFRRQPGAGTITVNPALGKAHLSWTRDRFDLRAFIQEVERFGYLFGPSRKESSQAARDLPLRIGICAALAMNVMMFSVSFYVGLAPNDGELFTLFSRIALGLSVVAVAVGGWPFFRTAWLGLRRGVLHLDLPIAAGILLAFTASLVRSLTGRGDLAYFDTLDVFITLMLVGRWLQQRVLDRNRRFLLDDAGAEGIHVRREEAGRIAIVPAPEIRSGDALIIAPGDLVPVESRLQLSSATISTDWINGESAPRRLLSGDVVPAGAFNAGTSAFHIEALTGFAESPLVALLRAARTGTSPISGGALFSRVSRFYVPAVLFLAAAGAWLWRGAGWSASLDVAAGLLIVTCPCALGIAVPLAEELAFAQLRRNGVFVRATDLLDRALQLKRVLFDKTGTLTLNRLELAHPAELDRLSASERNVLFDLTAGSNHPVSRAIAAELSHRNATFSRAQTTEVPGCGVELRRHSQLWRIGKASWAADRTSLPAHTVFTCDGQVLAILPTREAIRADAREEIGRLRALGLDVWLLSGDAPMQVAQVAASLDIPAAQARAGLTPEGKASIVAGLDQGDTLFIGDGVNDSLAFAAASMTGTPAIDRPVMPGKADFFLLGDGIVGVRRIVETAQILRATIRRILRTALVYNVAAVVLCLAGQMTPLRAAVAMPLSSVTVLLLAMAGFSQRRKANRATEQVAPLEPVPCTSS